MSVFHIFGIRHHGPGSAQTLRRALDDLQPDCILIEGAPDANALIADVRHSELVPPVAMLVYNPKNLQQAAYYPFAHYSPEWIAMQYGIANGIKTQFIDLPQSMEFARSEELFAPQAETDSNQRRDPLGYLAKLAGYSDGERWWETTFEHNETPHTETQNPLGTFADITTLMRELRAQMPTDSLPEQQREAYMRQEMRAAKTAGYQHIAVVCGAYHAPALADMATIKSAADSALLKGLKKINTTATWVPWTYSRLATSSGYGAGVISPNWYQILYDYPADAVTMWATQTARLLRTHDLESSSAGGIEAVRLAQTLATLRGRTRAGIDELHEAAVTVLAQGSEMAWRLIAEKMIIGDRLGEVPTALATLPLQQDLEATIKKLRMVRSPSKEPINAKGFLDLRDEKALAQSQLLWQLQLLHINWGIVGAATGREKGAFQEYWHLQWQPDFALRIIEAGTWGNTVLAAATAFVRHTATQTTTIAELTLLLTQVLKANLPAVLPTLLRQLQNRAAQTHDIGLLIDALPPLVAILRYGDTRQTDTAMVADVVAGMVPRIAVGLSAACANIDNDAAQTYFERIIAANRSLLILNNEIYKNLWYNALEAVATQKNSHAQLAGAATRLLFDAKIYTNQQAAQQLHYALSTPTEPEATVAWLGGFAHGSGQILVLHTDLWQLINDWLVQLVDDHFMQLLPLLRRSFAHFTTPEKSKMLALAQHGTAENDLLTNATELPLDATRVAILLPNLQRLLTIS